MKIQFRLLSLVPAALALASSMLLSSCATSEKARLQREVAQLIAPYDMQVGQIAFVNLDSGFVLIETIPGAPTTEGLLWTSKGAKGKSELLVSGERKRPFTAADIKSGTPGVGDPVFMLVRRTSGFGAPGTPGVN
jgi:hypothetical protein